MSETETSNVGKPQDGRARLVSLLDGVAIGFVVALILSQIDFFQELAGQLAFFVFLVSLVTMIILLFRALVKGETVWPEMIILLCVLLVSGFMMASPGSPLPVDAEGEGDGGSPPGQVFRSFFVKAEHFSGFDEVPDTAEGVHVFSKNVVEDRMECPLPAEFVGLADIQKVASGTPGVRLKVKAEDRMPFDVVYQVGNQTELRTPTPVPTPAPSGPTPHPVNISLPGTKIDGGPNMLFPSQLVDLIVYRPDGTSTPEAVAFESAVHAKVIEVRGEAGKENVMVNVAPDKFDALQMSIAPTDARIAARELPGSPTPTSAPTTAPPTTAAGARPSLEFTTEGVFNRHIELDADTVQPRASDLCVGNEYELVVVTEQQETTASETVVTKLDNDKVEVRFEAFLTAEGGSLPAYDKDRTTKLLFAVNKDEVNDLATNLAAAKSTWLVLKKKGDCCP